MRESRKAGSPARSGSPAGIWQLGLAQPARADEAGDAAGSLPLDRVAAQASHANVIATRCEGRQRPNAPRTAPSLSARAACRSLPARRRRGERQPRRGVDLHDPMEDVEDAVEGACPAELRDAYAACSRNSGAAPEAGWRPRPGRGNPTRPPARARTCSATAPRSTEQVCRGHRLHRCRPNVSTALGATEIRRRHEIGQAVPVRLVREPVNARARAGLGSLARAVADEQVRAGGLPRRSTPRAVRRGVSLAMRPAKSASDPSGSQAAGGPLPRVHPAAR
jgi:hypothetical protein